MAMSLLTLVSLLTLHTCSAPSLPLGTVCPVPCHCSPDTEHLTKGLLVSCDRKGLDQVPDNIPNVTTVLILSYNHLTTLANDSFLGLASLWELTLSFNFISSIEPDAFVGLTNLYTLSLRANRIPLSPSSYHPTVFQPLVALKILHLEGNVVKSDRKTFLKSASAKKSDQEQALLFASERDRPQHANQFLEALTNQSKTHTPDNDTETGDAGAIDEAGRAVQNAEVMTVRNELEMPDSKTSKKNNADTAVDFNYPDLALSTLSALKELLMDGLQDTPLGPGFGELTSLTSLSLSGRAGHCSLGNLTHKTFLHVPHVRYLNISQCAIGDVLPDTFSVLPELYSLDVCFNQGLGLNLLPKAVQSLIHTDLNDLFMDAIVPSSSPGITVTSDHLRLFRNLTSLRIVSAKFNRIVGFAAGLLCVAIPSSLQHVYLEANLLLLQPYVNDLRCLLGLQVLWVNGYDRYWSPPLRPPTLGNTPPESCGGNLAAGRQHLSVDTDTQDLASTELRHSSDSKRPLHNDEFFRDTGGTKEKLFSEAQRSRSVNQPMTEHTADDNNDDDYNEFYPAPNLREFKAEHAGLFYKLERIRVHPNNSLEKVDLSENHFWDWTGPVDGLERLKTLFLSDVFGETISDEFFTGFCGLEDLDISGNKLRDVFRNDREGKKLRGLTSLKRLTLRRNDLGELHNNTFHGLARLESLRLSVNALASFDVDLSHMERLQHLDLADNQLQTLSPHVRDHLDFVARIYRRVSVNMSLNPIACTCHNMDFLTWLRDSRVIEFGLSSNYFCKMSDGSTQTVTDIGATIAQLERTCVSYVGVFVGASACCVMAVTLLMGALAYRFRWKLRYLYYASRLSLRQQQQQQQQQRQEEFHYDAFVSFAVEDQEFVMRELKARLEDQQGLRLCIHTRDFVPGQYVASNIVDSVQRSRRTLVVVSRALLASDWCHYELQMALMESVHTGRDVLFFLLYQHVPAHELSRDMLANLQATSYMEFPEEEDDRHLFWARLARALKA